MAEPDYTDEIWKTIPFAPNYAVSTEGRVRRVSGGQGARPMILTQKDRTRAGYYRVRLSHGGKVRKWATHRLVALVHIGEPPTAHHQVAHADGDQANNRVVNLRWATSQENILDKQKHGTQARGETQGNAKLSNVSVIEIRNSGDTTVVLAQRFGVCTQTIRRVRSRENWGHV